MFGHSRLLNVDYGTYKRQLSNSKSPPVRKFEKDYMFSGSLRKSNNDLAIIDESNRLQRFSKILHKYKVKNSNYYPEVQKYIANEKANIEKQSIVASKDIKSKLNLPNIKLTKFQEIEEIKKENHNTNQQVNNIKILTRSVVNNTQNHMEITKNEKNEFDYTINKEQKEVKSFNQVNTSSSNYIQKINKNNKRDLNNSRIYLDSKNQKQNTSTSATPKKLYNKEDNLKAKKLKTINTNRSFKNNNNNNYNSIQQAINDTYKHFRSSSRSLDKDNSVEKSNTNTNNDLLALREINQKNLKRLFPNPVPQKDNSCKFIVSTENNGIVVKRALRYINNWTELDNKDSTLFNFKWLPTSGGIQFKKLGEFASVKQLVNHFECHSSISNKMNLFLNMFKYCEVGLL